MAINKTNSTIARYNALVNEAMILICYAEDLHVLGDAERAAFRLKLPGLESEQRMLVKGALDWLDMTENTTEYQQYLKDAATNTKRALATMRHAVKTIKAKLSPRSKRREKSKPGLSNNDQSVEKAQEPNEELSLTTTLSKSGNTLIAEFSGDKLTAATTEQMIEKLLNLGVTTSDLRFTAGTDHVLTVG